jgi:hypothetical protein
MIVSDKNFIKNHLEKNLPALPENEKKFLNFRKIECVISAVGGAIISYAAAKSLDSKEKSWMHYSAAILGGALAIRGLKNIKSLDQENQSE